MSKTWNTCNGNTAPSFTNIEVIVTHCNKKLKLEDENLIGQFKDDGFYLKGGGELSWNWDIIKWRLLK